LDSDHWTNLKKLFKEASNLEPENCSSFLDKECKGNEKLRKEVEALLVADRKTDQFMEAPVSSSIALEKNGRTLVDKNIGQYLIKSVISSGGMGTVYKAIQENPKRTVAIKVMSRQVSSKSSLRRFEYESQILAKLRHPNIAQVIEAGTHHEDGVDAPYFVMEHIPDAQPITDYAWDKRLKISDRIQLFIQICDAVHHGHQRGIIHRDLKPSNVLVDGSGRVKVIDFGVARVTNSDIHLTTEQTDIGQLIGTVQYMSPEQCKADPADLDIRSDVYALGVVLYELLCKIPPYDLKKAVIFEAVRIIQAEEPKRPSTTNRRLKGDLETIILKALEKDRNHRYQSMADFRSDLDCYLRGRVIQARPAGPAIRTLKCIKRNPVISTVVGMTVMTAFVLLAYILFVAYPQIREERDNAQRERGNAESSEKRAVVAMELSEKEAENTKTINTFLQEMLLSIDPLNSGLEVNVLDLLHKATDRIDKEFSEQPEIEGDLRFTLGVIYFNNSLSEAAEENFRASLDIFTRIYGEEHGKTLNSMNWLGYLLVQQKRLSEAEPLLLSAFNISKRVFGSRHRVYLKSMQFYASLLREQRKYDKAERYMRAALDQHRLILGEDHKQTLESMNDLALVLWKKGDLVEAASLFRSVIDKRTVLLGEDHIRTLEAMSNLAVVLLAKGQYAEAESINRKIHFIYNPVLGEDHPYTLMALNNLAKALEMQAKNSEAELIFRKIVEIRRRLSSEDHTDLLNAQTNLATVLVNLNKITEAEKILEEVLEKQRRLFGEEQVNTLQTRSILARILWKQRKLQSSESAHREVLQLQLKLLGDENQDTLTTMSNLASIIFESGRPDEAESMFNKVLDIRVKNLGEEHPDTLKTIINLALNKQSQKRLDEAETDFKKALKICRAVHGKNHPSTFACMLNLAVVASIQGKHVEAVDNHRKVLEICRHIYPAENMNTLKSIGNLAMALQKINEPVEASQLLEEAIGVSKGLFPQGHYLTASFHSMRGECLARLARYEEAEDHLLKGYSGLKTNLGDNHWRTQNTIDIIVIMYEVWKKPDKAAEWKKLLMKEKGGKDY